MCVWSERRETPEVEGVDDRNELGRVPRGPAVFRIFQCWRQLAENPITGTRGSSDFSNCWNGVISKKAPDFEEKSVLTWISFMKFSENIDVFTVNDRFWWKSQSFLTFLISFCLKPLFDERGRRRPLQSRLSPLFGGSWRTSGPPRGPGGPLGQSRGVQTPLDPPEGPGGLSEALGGGLQKGHFRGFLALLGNSCTQG